MSKEVRPSSFDGIKRTAKEISRKTGIAHAKALDEAAKLGGYQNFAHARKAFASGSPWTEAQSRSPRVDGQRGPLGFHQEARTDWIAACKIINPANSTALSWNSVSTIQAVLSHFMGENHNHVLLPTGGGVDFESAAPSNEARCIEFSSGSKIAYVAKPKRMTFECIAEDEAESFFLLELDNLPRSGVYEVDEDEDRDNQRITRLRQQEEVVELRPGTYVDRGVWDEGHLGYDESGYEIPLPASSRLVVRWMRGKMLFVCKRSRWNLDNSTYDGRHNNLTAQQIRHIIEMSIAAEETV